MEIRLYRVIGIGNVIAEAEKEFKNYQGVSYPGELISGAGNLVIVPLVPGFLDKRSEMMRGFMIPKHLIFYSGKVIEKSVLAYYEQFVKETIKHDSGIEVTNKMPSGGNGNGP